MFKLPNIVFNPIFTCFDCATQNTAEKMKIIANFLPNCDLYYYFFGLLRLGRDTDIRYLLR